MKLYPINYKNNAWNIVIKWSRLKRVSEYLKNPEDEDAGLYIILRRDGKKILYIGMTHRQFSIDRIKEHKYREGYVSTGVIEVKWSKCTEQRVKDAESLLIYYCKPRDNTMKKKWIALEDTLVENRGYGSFLPRYLFHGTCKSVP